MKMLVKSSDFITTLWSKGQIAITHTVNRHI